MRYKVTLPSGALAVYDIDRETQYVTRIVAYGKQIAVSFVGDEPQVWRDSSRYYDVCNEQETAEFNALPITAA